MKSASGFDDARALAGMSKLSTDNTEMRYRGESGRTYQEGKRAVPSGAYPWVARARAEKLSPHVRAEDTVLEFGVGYGWNLAALTCRRRLGHDVAEWVEASVVQHGIEFVPDLAVVPGSVADVVLCHHTLEHLKHPAASLEGMRRLLRPGGSLLLYAPWERERRHRRFRRGEPNHHLYTWTAQTLGNLVEDCGYEVSQAGTGVYGYDRFAACWAWRLRLGEAGFRLIRALLQTARPLREVRVVARWVIGPKLSVDASRATEEKEAACSEFIAR
jgi:SAM-dependent methyltransferase